MTVSSDLNRISYTGNGTTTVFPVNYYFLQNEHLQVILISATGTETPQTLTANYTVTGAGNEAGGTVTMLVAPPTGTTLVIQREVPATQETDYLANDPFPAESHERALDKLTMLVQQNERESDRALKIPLAAVQTTSTEMPLPQANRLLAWDQDGTAIRNFDPGTEFINVVGQQNSFADTFTGDGATTVFTLSGEPGSVANLDVSINGVTQVPSEDYTLSGSTLTFTTAPPAVASQVLARFTEVYAETSDASEVDYLPAGTGAVAMSVQAKLRETVSVKDFGAVGDGVTDDHDAIQSCWSYCLANATGMYFPAGTYVVINKNFPMGRINGLPPTSLLDCKNVTIFGDGRSTILKTVSGTGADVLQFNGAKNLHVKNLSITADVNTTDGAGSNCVSLTGGGDNITFENIYAFNPDYVEYPLYLDGGKGFTIQMTGFATELGTFMFTNCIADGCVYGFDVNPTINDVVVQPHVARISNCIAENCWYGFTVGAPAATAAIPSGYDMGVVIDGTSVNCQRGLVLGRAHGGDYRVQIINTKSKANLKLNPDGTAWSTTLNTDVVGILATYVKDAFIYIHGFANTVDNKIIIGGTTSGGGVAGSTSNVKAYFDLGGTSDVADFTVINSGGNTVASSDIHVTNNTTSSALPTVLYSASNDNLVIKGSQKKLQSPILDGSLGFTFTDGQQVLNTITRDSLGLYVQQTGSSSANAKVFGVKDNAGAQKFVVHNNGGIHSAGTATATSVATIKKALFFYDNAGNIDGYIPIYTTFS